LDKDHELASAYLDTMLVFDFVDLFGPTQYAFSAREELAGWKRADSASRSFFDSLFWVISAHNPYSIKVSDEENIRANEELLRDLMNFNFQLQPVSCRAVDGSWSEESFAVTKLGKTLAEVTETLMALGGKYKQNSIFQISNSRLKVIPVLNRKILGETDCYFYSNDKETSSW